MLAEESAAVRRAERPIKRFVPKTLFGRALLIIATPLILMQVISTFVFYDRHWDTMTRRLALSLAGDVALLIEGLPQPLREEDIKSSDALAREHLDIALTWRPGEILENTGPGQPRDRVEETMRDAMGEQVRRPYAIDTVSQARRVRIEVQMRDGVLGFEVHRKRLYSSTTYIFLMWMVGSSLVLFAIAIIFLRNQIRPIRRLAISARAFGLGREVGEFPSEGASEVRQAANAFRQMRDRIRRQVAQRTDMLSGVSHDLRTPLTRMKLQLAMLGDSEDIRDLQNDVVDMERMVEGYLAFARGEGQEVAVDSDIGQLVEDVVAPLRRAGRVIDLSSPAGTSASMPVRPQALRRALTNLLTNAQRHGERVSVILSHDEDGIDIRIEDDGPGIEAHLREDVFKPFFRLDTSRNLDTGGVGLGLTIARDIARGHGGELTLGQSELGGLATLIHLPR
jgi:two-component system osmolarity sensor histidine kinase EnvZ